VQLVLAMGYSVTVSAAELLMSILYKHLFDGDDLSIAIRHARTELYNNKERRAYFDQKIDLEDWLLPVVYQNQPVTLQPREFKPEERSAWLERKVEEKSYAPTEPQYGFVGRDIDILQIEKHLLAKRNILLIRGMGGAGKTTLLRHLAAWWHTTGFVQRVFYFGYDEKAWSLQQIMTSIAQQLYGPKYYTDFQPFAPAAQQAMLSQDLRGKNHLLILDNLESITGAHLAIQHTLPPDEQSALRSFLTDLAKGHTQVLLGSRGGEDWLAKGTFDDNIYELPGLDPEAASTLADRILERNNATKYRQDENVRKLIKVLDGFPLALEVVLANLAHQAPADVLAALQAGDVSVDPKSDSQDKTESILRCIDYSHSNLSPDAQQLLLCLAPFTSVIWQDMLDEYTGYLRERPTLASLPFKRWPEVIQEAINWGLLSADPDIPGFLRIQPIFPYFLRNRLHEPIQADMKSAIETAFREHYDQLGGMLNQLLNSKKPQERQVGQILTSLEYENLVTALKLALAAQVSILNCYKALSKYLDITKDHRRGLDLGQTVLSLLEAYPNEKLSGQLGAEFVGVIDDIASRLLELKQYAAAEMLYQKALAIWLENKSYDADAIKKQSASIYHNLGRVAQEQRQWEQAEAYYQQALQLKIEYNDRDKQAGTYHGLGNVAMEQRQWQQAEAYYQQSLLIYIEYKDRYSQANIYHQLGRVAEEQRQWQQAREYFLQALEIFVEYEDTYSRGVVLRSLARLWKASGDASVPATVATILGASIQETEKLLHEMLEEE
jgi:tetratricopeptide (TPR) repeat protein